MLPAFRRAQSTKQKKFESRLLKLAEDELRTDGKSIRDTDLSKWIAPPVSWGYENLVHIAVKRFGDFLQIMGPRDPRITETDPKKYFSLGSRLLTIEIIKLFMLFLARTSTGMIDDRITSKTMQGYISHTIGAAYRCTGVKQFTREEVKQVYTYIRNLEQDGELSNKARFKHVATNNDLDLLIEAAFSDEFSLNVQSIRSVLNIALYMNLFVDSCGRGSDLAYGGASIAEQENHCLCWDHCRFYVVNVDDGDRVIAANIEIKFQKGQRSKDVQKIVTLRLLPSNMAMHDSLRLLVTLALVDGVFGPGATWASLIAVDPGAHSREIIQSHTFIGVPVFRSHRGQPLRSGKLGESIVHLGRIVGFEHNSTSYTLRRGYANMLNVKACVEDRKSLMGHKTNSEIYSHYHSAISSLHVQELFRDIRTVEHAEMHSLSLNRMQQLPQTISPEGWEQVQQDAELVQFALEASQLSAALCEVYGSNAAATRACDPRVPDLLTATSRLKNRRRALLRHIYQEEYRAQFVERAQLHVSPLCTSTTVVNPLSASDLLPIYSVYVSDAQDWVQHVEQEEQQSAEQLSGYENIIAEDARSLELSIEALDSGLMMTDKHVRARLNPALLPEESCKTRLHNINDGGARPKNMSITRVREAMSSGGLTDAALSQIMVEVFSATHRPGKYLQGEEPLLGTSICRFSGIDLSSDTHAPDTAHRAHFTMRQKAAAESFNKHLVPLDTSCSYYSQGPTQKKNPTLCGLRSKTHLGTKQVTFLLENGIATIRTVLF
ncbi:hypothetical protein LARI1_G007977 [Lachnellula arida]|uniref:Uncharacterized protein n=1 Tax=Lachnellula arida TaxID=1316785 RepID=A0A8T9B2W9_9HELO|nr:hypothetical protein LARI1_G007977 [Lachnellula arida]